MQIVICNCNANFCSSIKNVLKIWREVIIHFIHFVKIVNAFERHHYKELIYTCTSVDG